MSAPTVDPQAVSGHAASAQAPDAPAQTPPARSTRGRRIAACAIVPAVLLAAVVASLTIGSNAIPLEQLWRAVTTGVADPAVSTVLFDLRLPRTIVGVLVGLALAVAGAVMQSLVRNPLADPGILGVNAGAGLAIVLAVALTGVSGIGWYLWFGFLGAALATIGVAVLGAVGGGAATPVRLALAGVAVSAALGALIQTVTLANQTAFNEFRFWAAGSLEGRSWPVVSAVVAPILLGALIAAAIGPALNALALGDETARALGVAVSRTRALGLVATTLLAGAATAAAGPIAFVGLAAPIVVRRLVGSDMRLVIALCALLGPAWLLASDVFARVVVAPEETQAGIVTALLGAPVFIALVRRRKLPAL